MHRFDREELRIHSLNERENKLEIERIAVHPDTVPEVPKRESQQIADTASSIIAARENGRPVILTFGAHLIKNGLSPVVIHLLEKGWVTHLATNGAGAIHDWEFAYLGKTAEDVRTNTAAGRFGIWDETGKFISLAIATWGIEGLGIGASVGRLITEDSLSIPSRRELESRISSALSCNEVDETIGALADMLYLVSKFDLSPGQFEVPHPFKRFSVQRAAWEAGVPFTVHPGIGYDILHTHPMCAGGPLGRGAMRDFLVYAYNVSRLSGGVHLSVGSAIMAPMIFEKSLSMANNLAISHESRPLADYHLVVVDIQEGGGWDWRRGEPPMDNPAYYLRFCKTFYRMGGRLDYICLDNVKFLLALYHALEEK